MLIFLRMMSREQVMTNEFPSYDRRRLLRMALYALALAPLARLAMGDGVAAEDLSKLSLDDPQAKALNYQHDAGKVAADTYKQGQFCHNCKLYTGEDEAQWGPCSIFPGKRVNREGWCSAYVKA